MVNFCKVWVSVFVSLCYCYAMAKFAPKGIPRLFGLLPIICLFLFLPLKLFSVHLGGMTAFFIAWLANFKLLLFAFGKGPLSSNPEISLGSFIAVACLPIKIQQNPPPIPSAKPKINGQKSIVSYAMKGLVLGFLMRAHDYTEHMHPKLILAMYSFHIYLCLEIMLAMVASLSRALLGLELEPQFNEPYLSTSLQDFWGRRWNIMVTSILRPTVYGPSLQLSARVMGRKWAPLPAIMTTFVVSAIMHELVFYYLGRVKPTWEITWFFLLHGFCLALEVFLKKALTGKFRLPRFITGPLTVGFVMVTAFWLFFPQLLRCNGDVRAFDEYAAVGAFVKNVGSVLSFKTLNSPMVLYASPF